MQTVRFAGALTLLLSAVEAGAAIGNVVVTSAASFEAGLPPKGSIAAIFCTGLEGIRGTVSAQSTPLPRELAGVRVKVGGADAPIFAVAGMSGYQQINIQVPQEATIQVPDGWPVGNAEARVDLVIEQMEQRASIQVTVRKSPGDFFESDGGFAIIQHAKDYSLVTQENPARPDEVLIAYLTGMRGTRPVVPTGVRSPSDPPALVPQTSLIIDSEDIVLRLRPDAVVVLSPDFLGLVPGLVGVYQINFKLREQELLFGERPLAPFNTEFYLVRSYCPSGSNCHPSTIPKFLSKWVRIPIAPTQ